MNTLQVKPNENAEVTREHGQHLLREMIRIRRLEDKSAEMYSAMKIRGFLHLYNGEEAVAVGVTQALSPDDLVVATYREHGQALARGMPMTRIMAELYGKVEGCSRGRGGSMHLFCKETNLFGGNAIVGGGLPLAVGLGLADKLRQIDRVTACFFGDGAVAEGEFHESLNLAVLWKLPVFCICENNQYGMGTAIEYSASVTNIAYKASAYGIMSQQIDGMDVLSVEAAAKKAVEYIHETGKPYFIECVTYRFRAHSMFDAELYRSKDEVEHWKQRDPIALFTDYLLERDLITREELEAMEREVDAEVEDAVAFAEAGSWEPVEDLYRFVYTEEGATS